MASERMYAAPGRKMDSAFTIQDKEQFNFTSINWTHWEYKNDMDMFFLDDGFLGCSYPPDFDDEEFDSDFDDEEFDLKLSTYSPRLVTFE